MVADDLEEIFKETVMSVLFKKQIKRFKVQNTAIGGVFDSVKNMNLRNLFIKKLCALYDVKTYLGKDFLDNCKEPDSNGII